MSLQKSTWISYTISGTQWSQWVKEEKVSNSDKLELDGRILKAKYLWPKNSRRQNLNILQLQSSKQWTSDKFEPA